jgi:hypothetical protein
MTHKVREIDLREFPEVARLADEVCESNEPVVLRRGDEEVAQIVPIAHSARRAASAVTEADYEAFLSSAGGWADVDTDAFLAANRESRDKSSRPAIDL